ncbi:MAG: HAMP domain-containing histidine kinase [Clostridiales bacterium]|jgi:signal transduction histidine kinase|nr:HAMP domain-containing histidine kinase [Clostridiales bacterium]
MIPANRNEREAASSLSVREMAATLAHEVKNPLSLVRACINLLELDDEQGSHQKSYDLIKRELDKINSLVTDMVDLTLVSPEYSAVDAGALLGSLAAPFVQAHPEIAFNLAIPDAELFITGNPSKLKLVLNNLIKNAIDAVEAAEPAAGKNIAVSLTADGGAAVFTIRDNGVGLPGVTFDTLTEPRFTTKRGGSGLGLYASRVIVSQHGGKLCIINRPGGGCIVTVMIPMSST